MILKPIRGSIFIKWLHPSLTHQAASLECYSCENFWTRGDFHDMLREGTVGGYMATDFTTPIGFLVYENEPDLDRVLIHNLVVHPDYRRQGIATAMVEKTMGVMKALHFHKTAAIVKDSNLAAQKFFQNQGFKAVEVLKSYFRDEYEDAIDEFDGYLFVHEEEF
jgi:ribosomal-protein-alanine N-acetyltransferase